jgi:hypothetical protein
VVAQALLVAKLLQEELVVEVRELQYQPLELVTQGAVVVVETSLATKLELALLVVLES